MKQLATRLQDNDDRQFDSAFWELYLHEAYRRSGYSIQVEPKLRNTARRPDFHISNADEAFYLEATSVRKDTRIIKSDRRLAPLLDALIEAQSPVPFHVWLKCHRFGKQSIPIRRSVKKIQNWLSTLDYDEVRMRYKDSVHRLPECKFDINGWELVFTAIPYESQAQSQYPLLQTWSDMSKGITKPLHDLRAAIYRSARKKAKAYPNLEYPLILAIQINDQWHADDHHVTRALYGAHWFPSTHTSYGGMLLREVESLWVKNNGEYKNDHIPQVVVAMNLHIGNLGTRPEAWSNPNPSVPKLTSPDLFTEVFANHPGIYTKQPGTPPDVYFG